MSNKHWCMPKYPLWQMAERLRVTGGMKQLAYYEYVQERSIEQNDLTSLHIARMEQYLIEHKTPSLFISSRELTRFIYESSYDAELLLQSMNTNPRFYCFPQMVIDGVDLQSCSAGLFDCDFFKPEDRTQHILTMQYGKNLLTNNFPLDISCVRQVVKNGVKAFPILDSDVNDQGRSRHALHVHTKLCLGACVYASAFPDYIRDGLPDLVKAPEIHKPRILRAAPEILEGATRTSVSMHIRAGHFKTLQHERFKRNEDGTPKVIFVRQTVVAGKLTPKTAVGL